MATTPRSILTVTQAPAPVSAGTDVCVIVGAVPTNADKVVRRYTGFSGVLSRHDYAPVVDCAAIHATETDESFDFVGLPIDVAGVVGPIDTSGNTGTANCTIAVGADGSLDDCDIIIKAKNSGVVGTSLILLSYSLDGGRTYKTARLGTSLTYTIPYVGLTLTLTAGSLVEGDTILTAKSTAPLFSSDDFDDVRQALVERTLQINTIQAVGDSPSLSFAQAAVAEANEYHTANRRFTMIRLSAEDRWSAKMDKSHTTVVADATFAEVGATGDTITLGAGTWAALGVHANDMVKISGAANAGNNKAAYIAPASISTGVITLDTDDLVAETGNDVRFTFSGKLTLSASADTATRTKGSFISDGFRVGQTLVIENSASNDGGFLIENVSATVLTLAAGSVASDEAIAMADVDLTVVESIEDHADRIDLKYEDLTSEFRISMGRGRGFKLSPVLGFAMRRPVTWAANTVQYQHDVHVPTWQVALGALPGWSLRDTDGNLVEYDDRVHGGTASANGFTSFMTHPNKSSGTYIAQDLTRDADGNLLSVVSNVVTVNKACTACQSATEDEIGQRPQVEFDEDNVGRGTPDALALIRGRVEGKIDRVMLVDSGEGLPVSGIAWVPNPDSVLSGATPTLLGTLEISLNGLIHSVETEATVR